MIRILLVLFSIIILSVFPGHFTSAKAQGTGILVVTTTPVSGVIYVDYIFRGRKFWSGNLDAGMHVVSFGAVPEYITPPPQIVNLIADQAYYAIGLYRNMQETNRTTY